MQAMKTFKCDETALAEVADALMRGEVGVIPTDTVYGLAAHPSNQAAVDRLYSIKGREDGKPIALLASDAEAVARFGFPLSGKAAELAGERWPGALTLVVENAAGRTEGFRVPAHDWTRRLVERCGGVLRVTSANLSGLPAATTASDAMAQIGDKIAFAVDDGPSKVGVASTVVKVTKDGAIAVLRK